jgi:DNA-binding IclR family transcriptional regulator
MSDAGHPSNRDAARNSSGDRLLAVLGLFTVERPQWTVEAAAAELGVSAPTTYRYFKRLTTAGLISPVSGAGYTLGPAIIQMDRQIQISDPMLRAARGVMQSLIGHAPEGSTLLLCRLFHDRVMCVHQVQGRGPQEPVSYERGRLMPLFRGATSKIILAHLPARSVKSLFERNAAEIAAAGLGTSLAECRVALGRMRRAGVVVSRGEIDAGRIGLAVPVFDKDHAILGSLSVALPAARTDEALIERLKPLIAAGARDIERLMNDEPASQASPARLRVTGLPAGRRPAMRVAR